MGRGGGRGRGGPGGGGGRGRGGPGGRGGKREFDRKSGDTRTGIKAEDKRGGGGKGNWGNFEDDVKVAKNNLFVDNQYFNLMIFRLKEMKLTILQLRNLLRREKLLKTRKMEQLKRR